MFSMSCDVIGQQRLMSTARGFTLCVIGSQSVSEPFRRERCVGQGWPLVPLLFALVIEPLSRMPKQTMSGMHIDHIHMKHDTRCTVVAMCSHNITIFAGGLEDIAHENETIQCHVDELFASVDVRRENECDCGCGEGNSPSMGMML